MRSPMFSRQRPGVVTLLRHFGEQVEGVAAVEFALIAPIMAMMFVGAVEMSQAITANRRVTQVASTVGDLVARANGSVTNSGTGEQSLTDVMDVGTYLMPPFSASDLTITVTVVGSTSASTTAINTEWSCVYTGSSPGSVTCNANNKCLSAATSYTGLPSGLITAKSDYVVISKASYKYKPTLFDYFMKQASPSSNGIYTMTDTVYLKPRSSWPQLVLNGTTCSTF